jgi:hypothetical protein
LAKSAGTIKSQGRHDGKFKADAAHTLLKYLLFSWAAKFMGYPVPYFGAIHSRRQNEIKVTAPTPPSQSAANHSRRCDSRRDFGSVGINDNRFRL